MSREFFEGNFYQPKVRFASIKRLEELKAKAEGLRGSDYKDTLLSKLKLQYRNFAAQETALRRQHQLLPTTADFGPLLAEEATKKYQDAKRSKKIQDIRKHLKEIEDEEEVKFVSIKSPELAGQFKKFSRDKALANVLSAGSKSKQRVLEVSLEVPPHPPKLSQMSLFACTNDKLNQRLLPFYENAISTHIGDTTEWLLDEMLLDEVPLLDFEAQPLGKQAVPGP